jgi:hypothetical protein
MFQKIYYAQLALLILSSLYVVYRIRNSETSLLFALVAVTFITSIFSEALTDQGYSTKLTYSVYAIIEFIIFVIYYVKISDENNARILGGICLFGVTIFGISNLLFIQGWNAFNTYSNLLIDGCIALISILYLRSLVIRKDYINFFRYSPFWFFSGFLFYVCGDMLYSGTTNFLWKYDLDLAYLVGDIFKAVNILLYLFLFIATLCLIPEKSSSPSSAS